MSKDSFLHDLNGLFVSKCGKAPKACIVRFVGKVWDLGHIYGACNQEPPTREDHIKALACVGYTNEQAGILATFTHSIFTDAYNTGKQSAQALQN